MPVVCLVNQNPPNFPDIWLKICVILYSFQMLSCSSSTNFSRILRLLPPAARLLRSFDYGTSRHSAAQGVAVSFFPHWPSWPNLWYTRPLYLIRPSSPTLCSFPHLGSSDHTIELFCSLLTSFFPSSQSKRQPWHLRKTRWTIWDISSIEFLSAWFLCIEYITCHSWGYTDIRSFFL